ncbi:MAG: methyltransferase domain-containing protein [Scytolyngbya sp. HA4215-MV1]|nr:methyltransferase domain-containing protein [Scytolyngbya sp. HA4215-MV1]
MAAPTQTSVTPERLMQFMFGFAPTLIIETALKHHIFDVLNDVPKTVEQVSQDTGASVRGLRAVMNALVALNLLSKDTAQYYSLTPESSTFLVSAKPSFLGGMLGHASQSLLPPWLNLTGVVQTGKPVHAVNREAIGAPFFEGFVESLFPLNYPASQALAESLNLAETQQPFTVLDLAAGSGVWGIGLAKLLPQVQVTAVDWAQVIPVTQRIATQHGVRDQFQFIAGDLLEVEFGSGYLVAVLGQILHSEGEARSRQLLAKVFDSLVPGGTIAIAEWIANHDRSGPLNAMIFAVNMLIHTDQGDTFTTEEMEEWLHTAGFIDVRAVAAPGPSPLLLATKPH